MRARAGHLARIIAPLEAEAPGDDEALDPVEERLHQERERGRRERALEHQ